MQLFIAFYSFFLTLAIAWEINEAKKRSELAMKVEEVNGMLSDCPDEVLEVRLFFFALLGPHYLRIGEGRGGGGMVC